jgi:hypothetical protein
MATLTANGTVPAVPAVIGVNYPAPTVALGEFTGAKWVKFVGNTNGNNADFTQAFTVSVKINGVENSSVISQPFQYKINNTNAGTTPVIPQSATVELFGQIDIPQNIGVAKVVEVTVNTEAPVLA